MPIEAPLNHHYEKKGNYNFKGRIISIHGCIVQSIYRDIPTNVGF